jgi:hypothetical protein
MMEIRKSHIPLSSFTHLRFGYLRACAYIDAARDRNSSGLTREMENNMSYEMMEAQLVEGILELREREIVLLQSYVRLQFEPANSTAVIDQEFQRIQTRIQELEQLMAKMDAANVSTQIAMPFVPAAAAQVPQMSPGYQA